MNRVQRLTLVATGRGLFMIFLDVLVVNVALPRIRRDFGAGEAGLQWVVAAYSLAAFLEEFHRWIAARAKPFTTAREPAKLSQTTA